MISLIASVIVGIYFSHAGVNVIRNMTGMIEFAAQSSLPLPHISVPIGGLVLLAGGLLQASHIYFAYGSLLIIVFLCVANVFIHPIWKTSERMSASVNFALIALLLKTNNLLLI